MGFTLTEVVTYDEHLTPWTQEELQEYANNRLFIETGVVRITVIMGELAATASIEI